MTPVGDVLHHWAPSFVSYAGAMLVQSSLVILLLLAADVLLRHRVRPAIRYAVWMLALVKLLLPPTLTSPTSPLYWQPTERNIVVTADPFRGASADPATGVASDPATGAAAAAGRTVVLLERVPRTELLGYAVINVQFVLLMVWIAGALLGVSRIVRAGRAARRLLAIADAPPPSLVALTDECRRQLGVTSPIDVRCTVLAQVPAILGFWKPVILVPMQLVASLSPAQLRAVLLHEVAHAKRRDVWVDGVQALVQVVHWYNPLVWVANSVIRHVREQAVDEVVLMHMSETPEVYPETLLHVARLALPSPVRVARVAILDRGTGLRRRITRMLEGPAPSTVRVGVWNVLLIAAAALIVLPMAPRAASMAPCESTRVIAPIGFGPFDRDETEWLACIELRPGDMNVIAQAGGFTEWYDPSLARELYERARGLEPDLALHRALRRETYERAPQFAFNDGDMIKARAFAERLLARSQNKGWDSAWVDASVETAVHRANLILGRIAVREGRLTHAVEFLRRSGDLSDWPEGDSPGPSMSLAKDLLDVGETAAVLAYFEQCRRFWKTGGKVLDLWAAEVRAGRVPDFGSSLR